mgnify:FL=1
MTDLIKQLQIDEGSRKNTHGNHIPYKDTVGKTTLGYGRNIEDIGISEDEAMYLLRNDIARCRYECEIHIPIFKALNEVRQNVLINMCFMGIGKVLEFKKMLTALEAGDFKQASKEMLDSLWAKQVGDRAYRLSRQMEHG